MPAQTRDQYLAEQQQRQEATPASIVGNFPEVQAVSGPLTNSELRAAAVPVSGPATNAQLRATPLDVADAGLGTDGAAPPAITGTGVRGWLRGIYETAVSFLAVIHGPAVGVREASHERIHGGLLFSYCNEQALANAATADYLIVVGATPVHLIWEIEGDLAMRVELFSGVTTSVNGAAQTIQNRNIGSANVPAAAIYLTPTITGAGVMRCGKRSGSSTNKAVVGGADRSAHEWILPANTKALLRVTSLSGAGNTLNVSAEIIFYELGV